MATPRSRHDYGIQIFGFVRNIVAAMLYPYTVVLKGGRILID
ncbi:hypothetical protein [Limnofasciculus baicalensis]|nr:hypothetical protein [Limnofasciculus baicalensis]